MSHLVSNENESRKRPSSKYGIYNLQQGNQCLNKDDKAGTAKESGKLLRNLSFSGTSHPHIDQTDMSCVAYKDTNDVLGSSNRISFYDNVPLPITMDYARNTYQKSETLRNDSVCTVSEPTNPRQFVHHTESDDDLSSVSSPDDEYDALDNKDQDHNVLRSDTNSSEILDSLDSGVSSSAVLRSPRYLCNWLHSFLIGFSSLIDHELLELLAKPEGFICLLVDFLNKNIHPIIISR